MSSRPYSEVALVERPALELLAELGWVVIDAYAEMLGSAGTLGRDSIHEVVLSHRLRDALRVLNPGVPDGVREEALAALAKDRGLMDSTRANREVHALLRDGYRAEWRDGHGVVQFATVRFIDFNDSTKNDWLAASQVWVAGPLHRRRTDTILFVNGIPLVLLEFKEPNRPVKAAFDENLTADVAGLCKVATLAEISAQGWSLNPGRYTGTAAADEDDENFTDRLSGLYEEFTRLSDEADALRSKVDAAVQGILGL